MSTRLQHPSEIEQSARGEHQMARQVWVDFNDVDEEGVVQTLLDFAERGFDPKARDIIMVGDDEGNLAEGEVLRVETDGLVAIALKPGASWPADHKPSASA